MLGVHRHGVVDELDRRRRYRDVHPCRPRHADACACVLRRDEPPRHRGHGALFPADGLINDAQRDFWGRAAITRLLDREISDDKVVTTRVVESKEHYGDYIVSVEVDGEYDKTGLPDPLILTFSFSLAGDAISRLIILANKPGY